MRGITLKRFFFRAYARAVDIVLAFCNKFKVAFYLANIDIACFRTLRFDGICSSDTSNFC